jgi:transcriptional regulator with XRE-family HTH domain
MNSHPYHRSLAATLKALRQHLGLKQYYLSEISGISPSRLCKFENAQEEVSFPNLRLLAIALKVPAIDIIDLAQADESCNFCSRTEHAIRQSIPEIFVSSGLLTRYSEEEVFSIVLRISENKKALAGGGVSYPKYQVLQAIPAPVALLCA